ncbi:MAG: shikimate dehydrogenase [Anaerolineales bacterium]|nr:shikimate dehydrogenase [Anaerolineales bacterium]
MINLGLIGYPLQHSLSPVLHRAALEACNLMGTYMLFPVPPSESYQLEKLLNRVRNSDLTGLNVTIPYKQTIIPYLDDLTTTARAIGAVNTIFMRQGQLIGDNTDAAGFIADLRNIMPENIQKENHRSVFVLGGGGAASAIIYALIQEGWHVTLATRRSENAVDIIARFSDHTSKIIKINYEVDAIRSLTPSPHLIVNATPVGMTPNIENSPWPGDIPLPRGAMIYDLVYNPRDTKFVLDGRAAGLFSKTGLGMLVEQAALAFEIWTGCKVPREHLFTVLEEE